MCVDNAEIMCSNDYSSSTVLQFFFLRECNKGSTKKWAQLRNFNELMSPL